MRARKWYWSHIAFTVVLAIAIAAFSPFLDLLASAFGLDQQDWPARQSQNAQRIRISISKTVEFSFDETIVTAIVSDPEIVSANIQSDHVLVLTGLRLGHTILIVSGRTRQVTYALDVVRSANSGQHKLNHSAERLPPFAGSQAFYFTPGNRNEPSSFLYTFDFRQQLQNQRTLRAAGELFRFFGDREKLLNAPLATVFGANRLMFGVDSRTTKLDLLDSQLRRSRIGFNGYTLRGMHFLSTPESRWRGLEFFAGNARPQVAIFSHGDGRLAGVNFPVVSSRTVGVEVGAVWIAPSRRENTKSPESAFVWQTALRYSPGERTSMVGELAYSGQGLSWSGRADLQRGPFVFSGELLHLSRNSPLIAIGAQPEGRTSALASLQWTPGARFNTVASYARTEATSGTARAALNSRLLLVRTNYQPAPGSLLSFIFKDQLIDLPVSLLIAVPFNLENRSIGFKWNQRVNGNWANNLEANFTFSREDNTKLETNRGLNLREQLRYRWRHGSAEWFINFRSHTPSLDGLILRNPTLLPLDFRPAFAADPRGFLLRNRFALPLLLNGVELPATRETATGVNLQASFRRATFTGEAVSRSGTFAAAPQNDFEVSVTGNFRLDAANSLQARVSRLFGLSGITAQTAVTIGYVHRFGADSGDGFQFSKWLGIRRSRIQGRVFMDLNNNDQQDSNENGIAGITVQLNTSRTVTTDARGDFKFESLEAGEYELTLLSNALGVILRAGSMLHRISVSPRQTVTISLGLSNTGSVAGRVFNDLLLTERNTAGDAPGLKAVSLKLYQIDGNASAPKEQRWFYQTTNSNGDYQFRNLAPGRYVLQVDPNTLPENFHVPLKMSWDFTLGPLQNLYLDLPFSAQRAVSGLVYVDVDGDDRFDSRKDSIVAGARIVAGASEAVSTRDGLYLLRSLPAGPLTIEVYSPAGKLSGRVRVELASEPVFRTGVNLKIRSELSP